MEMSLTRTELREKAVQVLYQVYIYDNAKINYNLKDIIKEQIGFENEFVLELVSGVINNQDTITVLANKYLKDWDIDRLSKVDKAIMCIGIYELMYTETPPIVCINEAVELSKKYSDDNVVKMINASLDKIYHEEKNE